MKIGDVKIGEEYAVHDAPKWNLGWQAFPRRARAVAIETVEEKVWSSNAFGTRTTRNVRQVRIELLDAPTQERSGARNRVLSEPEGGQIVVGAKYLLGPWKEMKQSVKYAIEARDRKEEACAAMRARLKMVLGVKNDHDVPHLYAFSRSKNRIDVDATFRGEELERLVSLAEKGLAAK